MGEGNSKIRFKVGPMEVEFEGSEAFMEEALPGLISNVLEQYESHKESLPEGRELTRDSYAVPQPHVQTAQSNGASGSDMSTSTIASITKVNSGSDLIMAAAACLTMTHGAERMTRAEILKEMQTATSYYKQTYSNNLSAYLDRLVKDDRLRLVAKDTYGMSATEKQSMGAKLAAG